VREESLVEIMEARVCNELGILLEGKDGTVEHGLNSVKGGIVDMYFRRVDKEKRVVSIIVLHLGNVCLVCVEGGA
jgi:hypothetical protein